MAAGIPDMALVADVKLYDVCHNASRKMLRPHRA